MSDVPGFDAYAAGVESEFREDVGYFGPQNTLDEMNSINTAIQQLNGLIIAPSAKIRPEFIDNWAKFKSEWDGFFDSHSSTVNPLDYISRSLNETMDKVQEYRKRVNSWQDALQKEGVAVSTPSLPKSKDDEGFPWVKVGLIGGGLIIGYLVIKEVARGVGDAVSATGKRLVE